MPQLQAFLASTSPNTNPNLNIRNATEYMRRYIKGEDVIQPDFRIPENAVGRTPGKQIGMEKGRIDNLEKSARGEIDLLEKEKVRNMGQALRGDPEAAVFDRHYAYMSEEPDLGIYTAPTPGKMPSLVSDEYGELYNTVAEEAAKAGRSPRDYSADAWTGFREYLKRTRGGIPHSSKGMADIFSDLIEEKARHLGITPDQLKKELGKGNAELLSLLIATPVGAKLYADYQAEKDSSVLGM
jgi:hypothetical protein